MNITCGFTKGSSPMKQFSVLLMTLFLTGCGFSGIMPEKYDGEALEVNEEAAEITGEAVMISAGTYEIGEDIEEGRYRIGGGDTSAGALVTYDSEGTRLLEIAMGIFTTDLILDLSEGMQLDYKSRDAEIELVPAEEGMMKAGS